MASPQSFRCFYINLNASVDRRAEIEAELLAAGVEAERVSGFDARQGYRLEDVAYRPGLRRFIGAPLGGGEIGCTESHRRALHRFVESRAEFGLILEDDALLLRGFKAAVEAVIAETAGWDVVRLEWRKRGVLADPGIVVATGHAILIPKNVTFGGTAMLYTRRAAERVLKSLGRGYFQGNDPHIGSMVGFGFRFFQISPPVASEREMPSLLGNRPEWSGGSNRTSSQRSRLQLQAFGIFRAWLSIRRRASAGSNAARLRRMSAALSRRKRPAQSQANRGGPAMAGIVRIVSLWVYPGQEAAFDAFEREAARIMMRHGGRIEHAVRLADPVTLSGTGSEAAGGAGDRPFEVHIVSFPDQAAFDAYRTDSATLALRDRRDQIIARTEIAAGREVGPYWTPPAV